MSHAMWTTFFVNNEMFAVRVDDVQEVLAEQPLTPVPLAPPYIAGLLNLRGQIMPTVELRRRLDMPARAPDTESNVVVVRNGGRALGVVVDTFGDILELDVNAWAPPPDTLIHKHRAFVFGIVPVANRIVLGLRVAQLNDDNLSRSEV